MGGLDTILVGREEYPSKPNSISCMANRKIYDYIKIKKLFQIFERSHLRGLYHTTRMVLKALHTASITLAGFSQSPMI